MWPINNFSRKEIWEEGEPRVSSTDDDVDDDPEKKVASVNESLN